MVAIPTSEKDLTQILNTGTVQEEPTRDYIGLSGIGKKCLRSIQYTWRLASDKLLPIRTKRIFRMGDLVEIEVVEMLKAQGIKIENDQREVIGFGGHWKGHIDGEATNVPAAHIVKHLLEIKSMADKYFKPLVKKGLQESNPGYYDQMQSYMDHGEYERGLLAVYNKNDSAMYTERVRPDHDRQRELRKKESEIAVAEFLFPRIGNGDPNWYECKLCDNRSVCYNQVKVNENCRTCSKADIMNDGVWHCTEHKKDLTFKEQKKGCDKYKKDEMFITVIDVTQGEK